MKKIILLLLIITLFGCDAAQSPADTATQDSLQTDDAPVTDKMSLADIQQKIMQTNAALDSYAMDMSMDMSTIVTGDEPMQLSTTMTGSGKVDRKNKKMINTMSLQMDMGDQDMEMDTVSYFVGNMMYTQMMGSWVKMEFEEDLWNENDQAAATLEMMKEAKITQLADENFNGKSMHVFEIEPDLKTLFEKAVSQQEGFDDFDPSQIDDMIKSYKVKVYVDKDSYIIHRSVIDMHMVMTDGLEDGIDSMDMQMDMDVTIKDVNKPQAIELPPEAADAMDLADMQSQ